MYNERAMLSMRKVGIDFRDIRMAVLVQRVVPAAYAFVIHTTNPSNGAPPLQSDLRLFYFLMLQMADESSAHGSTCHQHDLPSRFIPKQSVPNGWWARSERFCFELW